MLLKLATAMICAAYGENAVVNHVKDGIKNFTKNVSVLRMNHVLDAPKRLKRTNCKHCYKLDINSTQIEKELAKQFGVTQQAISVRLHTMGFRRKADGLRMNCPKTTKIDSAQNHYRR